MVVMICYATPHLLAPGAARRRRLFAVVQAVGLAVRPGALRSRAAAAGVATHELVRPRIRLDGLLPASSHRSGDGEGARRLFDAALRNRPYSAQARVRRPVEWIVLPHAAVAAVQLLLPAHQRRGQVTRYTQACAVT